MKKVQYTINNQLVRFTIEVAKELNLNNEAELQKLLEDICRQYSSPESIRLIRLRDGDRVIERLVDVQITVKFNFFPPSTPEGDKRVANLIGV